MQDKLDVYYTQSYDSSYEVSVEGGKHLVNLIKTVVVDGELRINNENKCDFMRSYKKGSIKVHVKSPHINTITNNSVGNFYSVNTITENTITYDIQNSGDVMLLVNCSF
ncbi:MAG TPA: DUF2807 domain-containing protein, partial [Nitrosopumilaceae archaeon]|nr:DUF2807 domain-containing protein [Nitrosopumilaceae archaeon]